MKNNKKSKNGYRILVSLDVHQSNIYLYALNRVTGEVLDDKNYQAGWKSVMKKLNKLGNKQDIEVLYEAGNQNPYEGIVFQIVSLEELER